MRRGGRLYGRPPFLPIVNEKIDSRLHSSFSSLILSAIASPDKLSSFPRPPESTAPGPLVNKGRYTEALDILRPLAKAHPDNTDVLFLTGLAAIEAARRLPAEKEKEKIALLDEAIAALRAILVDKPGLVRVRLELARAFFFKSEDRLARRHFEQVLAGKPPKLVAANINRFLRTMRARTALVGVRRRRRGSEHQHRRGLGRGDYLHTRAAVPPRRGRPGDFGRGPLRVGGRRIPAPPGKTVPAPPGRQRGAPWSTRGDSSIRPFCRDISARRWLVGRDTEVSLLGNARQRWTRRNAPYYLDLGARLEARRRLTRRITLTGRASWHRRDYRIQDSPRRVPVLRPLAGRLLAGNAHHQGRGGGPDTQRNARRGTRLAARHRLGAAGRLRWPCRSVSPWAAAASSAGRSTKAAGPPSRRTASRAMDMTRILRASVYNRAFTLYGFSPQLVVTNAVRDTNAQLHDYKRTNVELRFVRQF